VLWVAFAAANVLVIVMVAELETVPFHLIWVSLTIVYGYRVWTGLTTAGVLVAVSAVTGAALAFAVARSDAGFEEVLEVPLMAAMFVAMVWHARRRQAAVEEARRLAENEHVLLERQRDFVRDASHELRTPITIAYGHAELLRAAVTDPQAILDVNVILDELGRLSRLSERLLLLASAEGADLLQMRDVEPGSLAGETLRRWRPTAPRRWALRLELSPGAVVRADPDRLRDGLDALLENAVRATSEGQTIAVGARARGDRLVLEVADEGVGIEPERLASLFERFSRPDGPRTREDGGTGLGLPIVKAIAEAHGGTVEADSLPARGTTIRIVLPGLRVDVPGERSPTPVG
jgi:signal transduction histidine kinase